VMSIISTDWTVGCGWIISRLLITYMIMMMHVFMLYLPLASVLLWRLWLNQDNNGGNSALCDGSGGGGDMILASMAMVWVVV